MWLLWLAACGPDGRDPLPAASLDWGPCPDDYMDECATTEVPLDWMDPTGPWIEVTATRSLSGAGAQQLWLLQGGPGGASTVFATLAPALHDALPDVDLYALDHRGTGLSSRLGCPYPESEGSPGGTLVTSEEALDCLETVEREWGGGLDHFTTTADAHDLASLIARAREPGVPALVYGVSYGTTRALRLMQAHPDAADGVILDSVVSPGVDFLSQSHDHTDLVVARLAERCAADPICGEKLGPDPWTRLADVMDRLAEGHCADLGAGADDIRVAASAMAPHRLSQVHLMPLFYRLERCDPMDVQVLLHYLGWFSSASSGSPPTVIRDSFWVTYLHIAYSELWEDPAPSVDELAERCASTVLCPEVMARMGDYYDIWPRYPKDRWWSGWPEADVPVLAMNGDLDPQTPIEDAIAAADHLTAPHQTFVTVPDSPHGVFMESPTTVEGEPACGLQMMAGFIDDPEAPIDTSCLDRLERVDWDIPPEEALEVFGVADAWENDPLAAARTAPPVDWAALRELVRRLR